MSKASENLSLRHGSDLLLNMVKLKIGSTGGAVVVVVVGSVVVEIVVVVWGFEF